MDYFGECLKRISESVKFDSSQQPATEGKPFGEGAARCLAHFLALAESYGFETKNYDNYIGEVIFGEGKDFAVLAHLDVVPAGGGWTRKPFGGEIDYENERIWGRGTTDDKGPAIISLVCLKALKDAGFTPRRTVKLIVGCNEENGWQCIDYYKSRAVMPEEGFSPDADFPVIYAEKGILQLRLAFDCGDGFSALSGGERANMVCDLCTVRAPADGAKFKKYGLAYEDGKAVSRGKSAHGSAPHLGVNAIAPVLKYLGLDAVHALLFEDGFDLGKMRDDTGSLTFSPNVIKQCGRRVYVDCDIRYPASYDKESVLDAIAAKGVEYEILHYQAPLRNDKGCKLISTLCGVYNEVAGKNMQPVAIGGGTYARALKRGAAFGPEEDGDENTVHKADEYISFSKIKKCLEIYGLALRRLTEI